MFVFIANLPSCKMKQLFGVTHTYSGSTHSVLYQSMVYVWFLTLALLLYCYYDLGQFPKFSVTVSILVKWG